MFDCGFLPTLSEIHTWIWGPWLLALIMGVGVWVHLLTKGRLIPQLWHSFRLLRHSTHDSGSGQISPFKALMTTLSATIGTGSIAGVATAIAMGGPGALFWLWIAGLVGMATKFAEALLAVHYRSVDESGEYLGGPMYYIRKGLGTRWSWMAFAYAACAAVTAFGLGNLVQANAVAEIMQDTLGMSKLATGLGLGIIVAMVVLGGLNRVSKIAAKVVPIMALLYVVAGVIFLIMHLANLPDVFRLVLDYAWAPAPAIGGFAGASVASAVRMGIARGIFANEAGLGSGAISHATAKTASSVNQGLIAMWGTVIDTLIICNMSGLIILASGQWASGASGATLTSRAFCTVFPWGSWLVAICLFLFAFTTILGWGFYGERCFHYLVGSRGLIYYRLAWILALPIGATTHLASVWLVADILNAMMALPNLIAIIGLSAVVAKLCRDKL